MNKHRGEQKVIIDGEEYVARPSHEAMAEIESALSVGILKISSRFFRMEASSQEISQTLYSTIKTVIQPAKPSDMPWTRKEFDAHVFEKGLLSYWEPAMQLINTMVSGETEEEQNQKNEPSTDTATP